MGGYRRATRRPRPPGSTGHWPCGVCLQTVRGPYNRGATRADETVEGTAFRASDDSDAEIAKQNRTVRADQQVFRLDIAMNELVVVGVLEGLGDLPDVLHD